MTKYYKDMELSTFPVLHRVTSKEVMIYRNGSWISTTWEVEGFKRHLENSSLLEEITKEEAEAFMVMEELLDRDELSSTISDMIRDMNMISILPNLATPLKVDNNKILSFYNYILGKNKI